jgi:hypothetical protein
MFQATLWGAETFFLGSARGDMSPRLCYHVLVWAATIAQPGYRLYSWNQI